MGLSSLPVYYHPRGVLWYFHTYVSSGHFFWGGGVKVLNFNISGVFRKMNIFWGMKILCIFFGGNHKIGLYLGVISMHFRVIFKVKVHNGGYFLGLLKFQIFLGVLEIPYIFWGWTVDARPKPTYVKKWEYPPPWDYHLALDVFIDIAMNTVNMMLTHTADGYLQSVVPCTIIEIYWLYHSTQQIIWCRTHIMCLLLIGIKWLPCYVCSPFF